MNADRAVCIAREHIGLAAEYGSDRESLYASGIINGLLFAGVIDHVRFVSLHNEFNFQLKRATQRRKEGLPT